MAAAGLLSGAVGATGRCLSWYSLKAVNIATPARIIVAITIIAVTAFPLRKSFIFIKVNGKR